MATPRALQQIIMVTATKMSMPKIISRASTSQLRVASTASSTSEDISIQVSPETYPMKHFVDGSGASPNFIVSWPAQDTEKAISLAGNIMVTLNTIHKESHETIRITRPFYMLDGSGRRMGSMCIVKAPSLGQRSDLESSSNLEDLQIPGMWLKRYSTLHR